MAGKEIMTGMLNQGGAVIGMEVVVVDPHVMKEETTTGTELDRMTALEEEDAHLPLTTRC